MQNGFSLTYGRYFEIGILLTIVTNCVFMAISFGENDPVEQNAE